jgi:hypothetical protein
MRKGVETNAELCGLLIAEPCATGMPCQPPKDDPDQYDISSILEQNHQQFAADGRVLVGLSKNWFPQLDELPVCNKGPVSRA